MTTMVSIGANDAGWSRMLPPGSLAASTDFAVPPTSDAAPSAAAPRRKSRRFSMWFLLYGRMRAVGWEDRASLDAGAREKSMTIRYTARGELDRPPTVRAGTAGGRGVRAGEPCGRRPHARLSARRSVERRAPGGGVRIAHAQRPSVGAHVLRGVRRPGRRRPLLGGEPRARRRLERLALRRLPARHGSRGRRP